MIMKKFFLATCILIFSAFAVLAAEEYKAENLRCEYRANPLGIDRPYPLLSWGLQSSLRGDCQTQYEIIVSDNVKGIEALKGNMWNIRRKSQERDNIKYEGKPLKPLTQYYWKVRSYNSKGEPSPWSETATFETAKMGHDNWIATWIYDGEAEPASVEKFYEELPAPMFRKDVVVNKEIASARLYITALGYYEAYLNGVKVSETSIDPGWTSVDKRILYSTYDVTKLMSKGDNVVGAVVGNGYYNPLPMPVFTPLRKFLTIGRPSLLAELHINYVDGTKQIIPTDTSWCHTESPTLRNNVYLGELYDARREIKDWCTPKVSAESWKQAKKIAPASGVLQAQITPPIRVTKVVKPTRMYEPRPGVYMYDMGQNFAGVVRVKLSGERGERLTIRYGEDVYSDGSINVMTSVAGQQKRVWDADWSRPGQPQIAWQQDAYIFSGNGVEEWTPRFTFHGFRYVELTGLSKRPTLECVEGLRMNSDLEKAGSFESSSTMLNKINTAAEWTFLSNVFSVQSDCPAREKLGYGGDIVGTTDAFCYNFDMANFHTKTILDYKDSSRESGAMTETAPYMGIADLGFGDGSGPIGWQLAFGFAQKRLLDYYGNSRNIAENYDVLKKQVDFLISQSENYIITKCISDHETLDNPRPMELTGTAHLYHHIVLLSEFAKITGNNKDELHYATEAEKVKNAFIKKFYNGDGVFDAGTQTCQSFALYYDLIPDGDRDKTFKKLVERIKADGEHIRVGLFAVTMILNELSNNGEGDLAHRLIVNPEFPGYGYMINRGATTIWETWAYSDNTFSHNHPMFGAVSEWMYRSVLGINGTSKGFANIDIRPLPSEDLTWAKGSYNSVKGLIEVSWKKEGDRFSLDVTVPVCVTARVVVPNPQNKDVKESGNIIKSNDPLIKISGNSTYIVGSGTYSFTY